LGDVHLPNLGTFNVFYGPNGTGKSNILAAIRVLLQILRRETHLHPRGQECNDLTRAIMQNGVIRERDLCARDDTRKVILGARFTSAEAGSPLLSSGPLRLEDLVVEYTFDWVNQHRPKCFPTRLESNGQDVRESLTSEHTPYLMAFLGETLPTRAYTLIGAERSLSEGVAAAPTPDNTEDGLPPDTREQDLVSWHARHRRLPQALFYAANSPSSATHQRLEALRALLMGPPVNRQRFRPVQDPHTGVIELRERLPEPNPEGFEIPLSLAGLGIAQIYLIIAQAVLSGARAVGIEEPEAHLHAPTSGRDLSLLLQRLVQEKYIDQLFIATHHHQFAVAETFFDVSLDATGSTHVVPRPRDEAVKHFYEPSPYWDTLRGLVGAGMSPDAILLLDADGHPIRAKDVLASIEGDRRIADQFVEAATRAFVLSLAKDDQET
jgi:hypothetical protein